MMGDLQETGLWTQQSSGTYEFITLQDQGKLNPDKNPSMEAESKHIDI